MKEKLNNHIQCVEINQELYHRFKAEWCQRSIWGETTTRFLHLQGGFTLFAMLDGEPVGLVSVLWRQLPKPLPDTLEGYIDILEVFHGYKRQGVARILIEEVMRRAKAYGAHQIRAWSSEDKTEAIPMWKALGFTLCPATTYPGGQEVRGYFVTKVL